ncbi:hypothetical protein sS8_1397 [Methylocaldum marinum]|uniref:Glycosyltransferase 2-like domain-containing protein n=1 Tax=Methylocaldum marinum TaxID=1432792 RepID=A0A250KP56_9GAMM|nr:glycosyltransferase family 2 protein [Methylocaldum marinum]BBA33357.1 hypothetical protein sS8_1397 [Methylocaldum marinum]
MTTTPVLTIAIPAYNRPKELEFGLSKLIPQILGRYENDVEVIIADDSSPSDSLQAVREIANQYRFIHFDRHPKNIGLERNLIACTKKARGEFLWIFGDDDFLEASDSLEYIMTFLREERYDFYVLNRTRRSFDLSKLISPNWMGLDPDKCFTFSGLRDFCLSYGFISVIGFVSVNIFRRQAFCEIDANKYFGTMYPQLGAMVEAFHRRPTLLIGRPLICHRTQTQEEKKAALGVKQTEADFMSDVQRRNAIYFSHPYVAMILKLVECGAFQPDDILRIRENTVINGLLIDFFIETITLNHIMGLCVPRSTWEITSRFFATIPLDDSRRKRIEPILREHLQ